MLIKNSLKKYYTISTLCQIPVGKLFNVDIVQLVDTKSLRKFTFLDITLLCPVYKCAE